MMNDIETIRDVVMRERKMACLTVNGSTVCADMAMRSVIRTKAPTLHRFCAEMIFAL